MGASAQLLRIWAQIGDHTLSAAGLARRARLPPVPDQVQVQLISQTLRNERVHHVVRVLVLLHKPKSLCDSVNVRIHREVGLVEAEGEHDPGGLLPHAVEF